MRGAKQELSYCIYVTPETAACQLLSYRKNKPDCKMFLVVFIREILLDWAENW